MNKTPILEKNINQNSKNRKYERIGNKMQDYEIVMGLEIHAELSTKTKIFC